MRTVFPVTFRHYGLSDLCWCGHTLSLRPIYIGGLEQADLLDALTRLWFTLALQQERGRHLALKLLEPSTQ